MISAIRRSIVAGAAVAFFAIPPGAQAEPGPVTIRIDPKGSDVSATSGLVDHPVATLDNALALVARLRSQGNRRPIVIQFAPGAYRLDYGVRIGPEHNGPPDGALILRGAPNEATHLVGSVVVEPRAMPLPDDIAPRLPQTSLPHVKLYELPAAALEGARYAEASLLHHRPDRATLEVYDQAGALWPAGWPNGGWARTTAGSKPPDAPTFVLDKAHIDRWRSEPDLWAEGFFRYDWLFESLPVASVDAASGRLTLSMPSFEDTILADARLRVVHALSELDEPGEWWRDEADGLLVAWPRDDARPLEVAVADNLLHIEGASHVRIEGLDLEHARADAVVVHGGNDITIRNSTIRWVAGRGAVFDGTENSGIEGSTIADTGSSGIVLRGGDRIHLTAAHLFARDNKILRFARLVRTQAAGAEVDGVGNEISGNVFADAGAQAILIHGNNHRVVGNDISRILMGLTDNGAIYSGRDWTARGTLIARNFLHDIRADPGFETKGVYLDDFASGFTVRDNVFLRVEQPVFIGGGHDNVVDGNLFIASSPAIHVDSRGRTWAKDSITDPQSELRAAYTAMPVTSPVWRKSYPGLAGILADRPESGENNHLTGNTFVSSEPFRFIDGGERDLQDIRDNHGPAGIRLSSGRDLAALAAASSDPRDFSGLVDAEGRPVGSIPHQ